MGPAEVTFPVFPFHWCLAWTPLDQGFDLNSEAPLSIQLPCRELKSTKQHFIHQANVNSHS